MFYSTGRTSWTPVAHADGASALANASYHAIRTTTASTLRVMDIQVGGEASSSTVNVTRLRRLSTNASTPTDVAPGSLNPLLVSAAASQSYSAASTGPTIASTSHLVTLSYNAFGGSLRWVAAPGEEVYASAQTAPNGQIVLDNVTGTGVQSTGMTFEEI